MQHPKTVIVIGGGIVGLSCAFFARRSGHRVRVIDPDIASRRASFGNAGVLAVCETFPLATPALLRQLPSLLLSRDSPLQIRWRYIPVLLPWLIRFARSSAREPFLRAATALSSLLQTAVDAHAELAAGCSATELLAPTGWIKAYQSEEAYRSQGNERSELADWGVAMQPLGASDIDALAPGFEGVFTKATLFTDCQQVKNPGEYVARIADGCARQGVEFIRDSARGVVFTNGRLSAVRLSDGVVEGDSFVIACGAWSKALAAELGDNVPLDTERGYHIMLDAGHRTLLQSPLFWHEKSVVFSQLDYGLRMTSSVEFAGLDAPPAFGNIDRTLSAIRGIVPALAELPVDDRWLGFRPSMPDSVPVIGPSVRHPNCFLAFGHGHLGLTLGPQTGRLIAQAIQGRKTDIDLAPFSPSRFGSR
ncbi:FAD-binding oxidoreductase [Trinickia caryophylli]|uniref:D-amino-acid dehydrogenase n=1 Tax=Trinickia caryophylli TaxID=28094 RepID=A0A1X7G5H3_TRICW|nr:FAD-binding oxidoreductase [Trinickia caryophylli]PMS13763.1 FAD-binding oxidoreductase [Trinickia caryophylli]TRX14262.1 FAD-binding oxidoreductase [Trinickia caryophylli]WQE14093.1 FAD-binding oxidoreductase [Trinickia caryophylli]SMF63589.1 D-amino-acid dehydrogenase [Trinickia caryophylli]